MIRFHFVIIFKGELAQLQSCWYRFRAMSVRPFNGRVSFFSIIRCAERKTCVRTNAEKKTTAPKKSGGSAGYSGFICTGAAGVQRTAGSWYLVSKQRHETGPRMGVDHATGLQA